jgi:hypothetical protein
MARRTVCVAGLIFLSLLACAMPAEQIKSFDELGSADVVVVGRIELHPPLQPGEQLLVASASSLDARRQKDAFYLVISDHLINLGEKKERTANTTAFGEDTALTYVQKNFFIKAVTRPLYISGGFLYTAVTEGRRELAPLQAALRVDIQPRDRAVYIGTIEFHRDEFFRVSKVIVRNDYARAAGEFKKKFGTKYKLTERLVFKVAI